MNFEQIKSAFNNEWINKMCDDLTYPNEFVERNKINILESLQATMNSNFDMSVPAFKDQRNAYLFVSDCIEKELEIACYATV